MPIIAVIGLYDTYQKCMRLEALTIHVPLSPITPYVAPIKEKLLLHAVHAVVEEKYTHSSSTVVSLVFSLLSVLCSLPWKHSMQSTHNLDRKND